MQNVPSCSWGRQRYSYCLPEQDDISIFILQLPKVKIRILSDFSSLLLCFLWSIPRGRRHLMVFIVQVKKCFKCSRRTSTTLPHTEAFSTFTISKAFLQISQGTVSSKVNVLWICEYNSYLEINFMRGLNYMEFLQILCHCSWTPTFSIHAVRKCSCISVYYQTGSSQTTWQHLLRLLQAYLHTIHTICFHLFKKGI